MSTQKATYIMTLQEGQVLSFLIDAEGKTLEIHADDLHSTEEKPGDVYAARVEKVMPGLGAAFICYAPGKTGYLQLDTCSNAVMIRQSREGQIRVDDELIVQLSKLNAPPKRPIFSGRIELTGTYAVVGLPAHPACGASDSSGAPAASAARSASVASADSVASVASAASDARSASAASAASASRSASVASAASGSSAAPAVSGSSAAPAVSGSSVASAARSASVASAASADSVVSVASADSTVSGAAAASGVSDVPITSGISPEISVSRKLAPEVRSHWRELVREHMMQRQDDISFSVVIRTNAAAAPEEEVLAELDGLCGQLEEMCCSAMHRTVPCALNIADTAWLERLRSLPAEKTGRIVADGSICEAAGNAAGRNTADCSLYNMVREYMSRHTPQLLPVLVRHEDPMIGIRALYSLDTRLEEALGKKVWLKSGGFLVIEQTEALVSIDVNTGKGSSESRKMSREQQYLRTNLEAAQEIARQVRVRGLSGIIIADFINMEEAESRTQVLEQLERALAQDPVPCSRPDFTRLGLVEFTRKRREKSLALTIGR